MMHASLSTGLADHQAARNVIRFPVASRRQAEAVELVGEWVRLQQHQDHADTLAELPGWRDKMQAWGRRHNHQPTPSDITEWTGQDRTALELVREWLTIQATYDAEADPVSKIAALMSWRLAVTKLMG